MSVYTVINQQQLEHFLTDYSLGDLVSFSGIQAGIENTNYRINTTQGDFILTVFESLTDKELPDYLHLLNYLCNKDLPAPQPQVNKLGHILSRLKEKPAALFTCLLGQSIEAPSTEQCAEIGHYLAKLHLSAKASNFNKSNSKNLTGCQAVFNKIKANLADEDKLLLACELNFQSTYALPTLPQGVIHADLFKDNVLFNQGKLSGMVDFYNACHDYFIYDIAITINDWCTENNAINLAKVKTLLTAYKKVRLLTTDEEKHLNRFLRLAALRFFLSRLDHQLHPKTGELVLKKDPLVFRQLLEFHQQCSL